MNERIVMKLRKTIVTVVGIVFIIAGYAGAVTKDSSTWEAQR